MEILQIIAIGVACGIICGVVLGIGQYFLTFHEFPSRREIANLFKRGV